MYEETMAHNRNEHDDITSYCYIVRIVQSISCYSNDDANGVSFIITIYHCIVY